MKLYWVLRHVFGSLEVGGESTGGRGAWAWVRGWGLWKDLREE